MLPHFCVILNVAVSVHFSILRMTKHEDVKLQPINTVQHIYSLLKEYRTLVEKKYWNFNNSRCTRIWLKITFCCNRQGVCMLKATLSGRISFLRSLSVISSLRSTDPFPLHCKSLSLAWNVFFEEEKSLSVEISMLHVSLIYFESPYFIECRLDFFNSSPFTVRTEAKKHPKLIVQHIFRKLFQTFHFQGPKMSETISHCDWWFP